MPLADEHVLELRQDMSVDYFGWPYKQADGYWKYNVPYVDYGLWFPPNISAMFFEYQEYSVRRKSAPEPRQSAAA